MVEVVGDVGAVGRRNGERGEKEEGAGRVLAGGEEDEVAFIYKSDVWFLAKRQNGQMACAMNVGKEGRGFEDWKHQKGVLFLLNNLEE